jgi:di/tricarboxylate transporter
LLFTLDKIKIQVINKYNLAIENNENIEKIKKAKEEIDKNNYTTAFFILNNNIEDSNYLINFGIVPLIIIILSILIIKIKYKTNKSNLKEEKEKIIQEWDI